MSTPTTNSPVLSLRSAAFGYGATTIVSNVTFEVFPGEVIAVLGPNGAGKSTLTKGLLGLDDRLGGEFDLFGRPADQLRDRTRLGYVPQRHTLSNSVRATVREVVDVGRLPHRAWWQRASATDAQIVESALAQVGLSDLAASDVSALSGGQQRRVLIARALAGQPDVLIMDEPTAGVDTASQDVLAQVLQRLADSGTTLIIVTHELEALRGIVTRIIEIARGTVGFDGTPHEWADHEAARIHAASAHQSHDAHHAGEDRHNHNTRAPYGVGPVDLHGVRAGRHHHA